MIGFSEVQGVCKVADVAGAPTITEPGVHVDSGMVFMDLDVGVKLEAIVVADRATKHPELQHLSL